jgi:hypothetical protein
MMKMIDKIRPWANRLRTGAILCLSLLPELVADGAEGVNGKSGGGPVAEKQNGDALRRPGKNAQNATYLIAGRSIRLVDGRFELEAAPGSGARIRTDLFGKPVYGDLDDDGDEDAALLLVHSTGGSGSFYYVAASLQETGRYQGTKAVLLGDRVAPQDMRIRNGIIIINYADRKPGEPMTASPSVGRSMYLTVKGGELAAVPPLGEGEDVVDGWVIIGHEVRVFVPCLLKTGLWILGDSPALQKIISAHSKTLKAGKPYRPVFMTLAGRYAKPKTDGFGADYQGAFYASELVRVTPKGACSDGN